MGEVYISKFADWAEYDLNTEPIHKLLIKYDDLFDNPYRTEYKRFSFTERYYTWRRPWLGKVAGLAKPEYDSAERSWPEEHQERLVVYRDKPIEDRPTIYEQESSGAGP
jgi:hypothetical protein